jgi:CRISPR system Cascade subunit CasE
VEVKNYCPCLDVGDRLGFTLRANPVIAKRTEGKKHSAKHDVWMDAKRDGQAKGLFGVKLANYIAERAKNWLINRGEHAGFSLTPEAVQIGGYQQQRIFKKRSSTPIRYSFIDFGGVLTVQDPLKFENVLYAGIGRSKSFGCGLMLVRRL